jgi:protein-S-isoprenylcysteine O-methyltransferase Ste14
MVVLAQPWVWIVLAAVGWAMGFGVVGSKTLGRSLAFGIAMLLMAEVPRIILPLPFVVQPRLGLTALVAIPIGTLILAVGLYFGIPAMRIAPLTAPDRRQPLRTDGLYSVVRHPLMLCDILWPLGWSLILRSVIGVILAVAWIPIIWALTSVEERRMLEEYGDAYRDFQVRVPRLVPRLNRLGSRGALNR